MDELEEFKPKGFDLKVTHRDEKTGLITRKNPYKMRVTATSDGGKSRTFERPVGSGNLWNKKGEPAGRFVDGKWDKKAEHVAFIPPETEDQKLAKTVITKDARIAELERELASIKAEGQVKPTKAAAAKKE